jgi:hypothetical protein
MAFVERVEAALKARGWPLIDRTEIYAFEEWWQRIRGTNRARPDTVVFVLSPDSVASEVALRRSPLGSSTALRQSSAGTSTTRRCRKRWRG